MVPTAPISEAVDELVALIDADRLITEQRNGSGPSKPTSPRLRMAPAAAAA
ncbi:MAG: hypothetical protein QOD57_534 [Actinomycetota bacterium]|jgi:hypothetical protein|nr:hypothetical protein [Actinomycetota bacterium]MDQ1502807.1 hypothetical protein [Actinomycetota bacterium]